MRLLPLIFAAGMAFGQEIRGIVTEIGVNQPIAGAQVALTRVGAANARSYQMLRAVTDAQGRFQFSSLAAGDYTVLASKPGYTQAGAISVSNHPFAQSFRLTRESTNQDAELYLAREGEIHGQIVDAETGLTMSGVPVTSYQVRFVNGYFNPQASTVRTGASGEFRISKLQMGDYLLKIDAGSGLFRPVARFSPEDADQGDREYESGYFPGALPYPQASRVKLGSGGSVDLGVIRLKKTARYRTVLSVAPQDCAFGTYVKVTISGQDPS